MRFAWLEMGVLQLHGSDRIPFLHGQCTNDVRGLAIGTTCRALILNAKGQIEFDITVLRRSDDLMVFCPLGLEEVLFERLKRYIIFDDVQMVVSTDWRLLHLIPDLGTSAAPLDLGTSAAPLDLGTSAAPLDLGTSAALPYLETSAAHWESNRGFGIGQDILFSVSELPTLENARPLENLELARVEASLPQAHSDAFLGLLPQECGLEFAVSYKKGCYIGQEIMARLEARGTRRYELRRVRLANAVARGTKIKLEQREVGQLGAVIQDDAAFIALAVLRRDLAPEAALLADSVALRLER